MIQKWKMCQIKIYQRPPIQLSAGGKNSFPHNSKATHSKKIQQPFKSALKEQSALWYLLNMFNFLIAICFQKLTRGPCKFTIVI